MEFKITEWHEKSLPGRPRYVITDAGTGQVLDDAFGYGYHSAEKAENAWKTRHHKAITTIEQILRALNQASWVIACVQMRDQLRYVIKDAATGYILDDANGRGYISYSSAYRRWMNQNKEFFVVSRKRALQEIARLHCWAVRKITTREMGPEPRIAIVDTRNGKVVDDAFGMGYKSKQCAEGFMDRLQWEARMEEEKMQEEKDTP